MTQTSRPQSGRAADGYVDGGGYTAAQWARLFSTILTLDETDEGILYHLDRLEVTSPGDAQITVASGGALVRGHWYMNEDQDDPSDPSDVDFVVSTPAADRDDLVVLVQNNTNLPYDGTPDYGSAVLEFPTDLTDYDGASSVPAQSCRLAILTGVAGGAARALVQDIAVDGDIWMIEIGGYTIANDDTISNLDWNSTRIAPRWDRFNIENGAITGEKLYDDAASFAKLGGGALKMDDRQGGSSTVWATQGTTDYSVEATDIIVKTGVAQTAGGGLTTIFFATAFAYAPIVLLTPYDATQAVIAVVYAVAAGQFSVHTFLDTGAAVSSVFQWIAIGPEP